MAKRSCAAKRCLMTEIESRKSQVYGFCFLFNQMSVFFLKIACHAGNDLYNIHSHRGRGEIGRRTGFRFQRRKV